MISGRSTAYFISIAVAEEKADESCYWIELRQELEVFAAERLAALHKETTEITPILTGAGKTAKLKWK